MNRKIVNIVLVWLAVAIVVIIVRDFIGNKAGKNKVNPYEFNIDEFRKVDSTQVLYVEKLRIPLKVSDWAGIAVCDSNIIVATDNRLLKFDFSGRQTFSKLTVDTATCITVDKNRQIWIGMSHYIVLYNASGVLIKRWNSFGEHSMITSVAVSGEYVYVADAGNRVVYQCTDSGQVLQKIGEKDEHKGIPGFVIPSPYFDVAVDPKSSSVWAVNTGRHKFENYSDDGNLLGSWGITGFKIEGFSGCCNPAHFAILPDGSFVTSEKGMPRIKWYDPHGRFLGIVAAPALFDGSLAPDVAVDQQGRVVALDFTRQQVRIFEKKKDGNK
jgi:hypothetical protein